MAKAVLISIRPEWVEKILNGEKTLEVRKTRPKLEAPFKCYIYRTKGTVPHIINGKWVQMEVGGTIIAEFTCDRIYELETRSPGGSYYVKGADQPTTNNVARQSCLTLMDMHEYLQAAKGYGWHISNLKIYDTPKELPQFRKCCGTQDCDKCQFWENTGEYAGCLTSEERRLNRAPQSWCYVEELK